MGLNNEPDVSRNMVRVRRSISWDPELLEWIDKLVEEDYHFNSRSHFIEVLVRDFKAQREKASA